MDSINVEKIQALKRYKKQQFMNNLMFYPILALTCVIFCSSPFWFPSLYSSMKTFLCVSIPTILSFFFSAKSLFILGNIIVIFLLGESKIQSSDTTHARKLDRVVEDEKAKGRPMLQEKLAQVVECKRDEVVKIEPSVEVKKNYLITSRVENENECSGDNVEAEIEDLIESEVEEEMVKELSNDELNRRADDFIARVNKQIRFEADHEVLLCSY